MSSLLIKKLMIIYFNHAHLASSMTSEIRSLSCRVEYKMHD